MSEPKKGARGGARRGAGRKSKPASDRMIEWTVTTTPNQQKTAVILGDYNASAGVRIALDRARKTLKIPPPIGSIRKKPHKTTQKN